MGRGPEAERCLWRWSWRSKGAHVDVVCMMRNVWRGRRERSRGGRGKLQSLWLLEWWWCGMMSLCTCLSLCVFVCVWGREVRVEGFTFLEVFNYQLTNHASLNIDPFIITKNFRLFKCTRVRVWTNFIYYLSNPVYNYIKCWSIYIRMIWTLK